MNKEKELTFDDIFKIAEKENNDLRLSNSNGRWLTIYSSKEWVVYYRKPHARNITVLYRGENLNYALSVLLDIRDVIEYAKEINK